MSLPSKDPRYLAYENAGVTFEYLLPAINLTTGAFLGILLNFSVCYITIKYRKQYLALQSNTAILLTANSFCEILYYSGCSFRIVIALNGTNLIPFSKAILFQTQALIGYFSAIFMIFLLSLDRFLAVAFPIYYKNINRRKYIIGHFVLLFIFILYIIYLIIKSTYDFNDWPVNGSIPDYVNIITYNNILSSFLPLMFAPSVILYAFVGLMLKFRKVTSDESMKKVYRSLFLIVFINIGGYIISLVIVMYIIVPLAKNDPLHLQMYMSFCGIIAYIGGASNAPILFINSNDYNKAYKKEFKILNKLFEKIFKKNQQSNTPVVVLQRNITTNF